MKKMNGLLIKSASAVSAVLLLAGTASAQFPGTNGRLIFSAIAGNTSTFNGGHLLGTGMFTMKNDGSNIHQFSFPFMNSGADTSASYSPDGTKVAYSGEFSSGSGNVDILVKNADDTGTPVRITSDPGTDVHPRWSPDGTKIVFTRINGGDYEIYVANADGSGGEVVRTTNGAGGGQYGVFTPDGTKIVFIRGGGINTVNATGAAEAGNTVVLAHGSGIDVSQLDVSPSGNTVVFSNFDQSGSTTSSIRTVPLTGGSSTTIVDSSSLMYQDYPNYSPDGTKIAFVQKHNTDTTTGRGGIKVYDISTTSVSQLFVFDPQYASTYPDELTWGTNASTLSDNLAGGDSFNGANNTGLPNTASTFFKNPSNWIPTLLAGASILALAIYSRKWFKKEFSNKKR